MKQLSFGLVFTLLALFLAACSPSASGGMISPADYVSQYQSAGAAHYSFGCSVFLKSLFA